MPAQDNWARRFALYWSLERKLKAFMIAVVPHIFTKEKYNKTLGWGDTITIQLLTHIHATYGGIDDNMLVENLERIKIYGLPQPQLIRSSRKLSCAKGSHKQRGWHLQICCTIKICITVLEVTGLFCTPCRKWRANIPGAKSPANFWESNKENRRETVMLTQGTNPWPKISDPARHLMCHFQGWVLHHF